MIKQKPLFYFAYPFCFSLFIFTGYLNKYFYYGYSIIILAFFLCLLFLKKINIRKISFSIAIAFVFVFYLLLTSFYAVHADTTIKVGLFTLCCLMPGLFALYFVKISNLRMIYYFLVIFSLFFSFITIISIVFPTLYMNYILHILPEEMRTQALYFYTSTTSAGFTNQTGINAWFSVIGLGISFSAICAYKNKGYLFYFLICILAILFTSKRAHLLFSFSAVTIIYFSLNKYKIKKIFLYILLLITFCILFAYLFPTTVQNMLYRFFRDDESDISSGRFLLWGKALDLFLQKPYFGFGFGYFSRIMPMNVHNVFLQLLCETGIIGFCIFLLLLIVNISDSFALLKQYKKKSPINEKKITLFSLIFSIYIQFFFIIYCFTGNPLNDLFIFSVYFFSVCCVQLIKK